MRKLSLLLCFLVSALAASAQVLTDKTGVMVQPTSYFQGSCSTGRVGRSSDTGQTYFCVNGSWKSADLPACVSAPPSGACTGTATCTAILSGTATIYTCNNGVWTRVSGGGSSGGGAIGGPSAVQTTDGTGSFLDSGLTASGGALSVPGNLTCQELSLTSNGFTANFDASLTASRYYTTPNADGGILISTLSTNSPEASSSIWGVNNGLTFEGLTADVYETTLSPVDPTKDNLILIPDASGTMVVTEDNGPGAAAAARGHALLYGDPGFYTKPAFVDTYLNLFRGSTIRNSGGGIYADPVFTVSQCEAGNAETAGACPNAAVYDYTCVDAVDVITKTNSAGADGTDDLAVGDLILYIGSASSSATATPTGKTYLVTAIATGTGNGVNGCLNTQKKITVIPRIDNTTAGETIHIGGHWTTAMHQGFHPGYAMSYRAGYGLAFAKRSANAAQGRNLLANGTLSFTATRPKGWSLSNMAVSGANLVYPVVYGGAYNNGTNGTAIEGEFSTTPYPAIYASDCSVDGVNPGYIETDLNADGTADSIPVDSGAQYVLSGFVGPEGNSGGSFGLWSDKDGTLALLPEASAWTFNTYFATNFYGLPNYWYRVYTIPWDVSWVRVRAASSGGGCTDGYPTLDGVALRKNMYFGGAGDNDSDKPWSSGTTYAYGDTALYQGILWRSLQNSNTNHTPSSSLSVLWWSAQPGSYLINDMGSREGIATGDSWMYDDATDFSNGHRFCAGLNAGLAARGISGHFTCTGRNGETTQQLLDSTTCGPSDPTSGTLNCWNEQIAKYHPLYVYVNLYTNDADTANGNASPANAADYTARMMRISGRLQASGGLPLIQSPSPGVPGTPWAASYAYSVGNMVTNSGNLYTCITAGTSAGAGGPTTNASDITDGSVHWKYITNVPYRALGYLHAYYTLLRHAVLDNQ